MGKLKEIYGNSLDLLNADEIKILVTAITEDEVTNARMQCITNLHPNDITEMLRSMVNRGFLIEEGFGRGKKYMINEEFCSEKEELSSEEYLKEESKSNNLARKIESIDDLNLLNVKLNKVEEDILKIVINDGFTSTRINSEKLEIPKHISIRACNDLIEKGLIKREGTNRSTKYVLANDK